jgi:hypothetical protein
MTSCFLKHENSANSQEAVKSWQDTKTTLRDLNKQKSQAWQEVIEDHEKRITELEGKKPIPQIAQVRADGQEAGSDQMANQMNEQIEAIHKELQQVKDEHGEQLALHENQIKVLNENQDRMQKQVNEQQTTIQELKKELATQKKMHDATLNELAKALADQKLACEKMHKATINQLREALAEQKTAFEEKLEKQRKEHLTFQMAQFETMNTLKGLVTDFMDSPLYQLAMDQKRENEEQNSQQNQRDQQMRQTQQQ